MKTKKKIHITFIHGIANKPTAEKLLLEWKNALASDFKGNGDDIDLDTIGITTAMIYWADVLYDTPLQKLVSKALEAMEQGGYEDETILSDLKDNWRDELSEDEKKFVESIAVKTLADVPDPTLDELSKISNKMERFPIPWVLKKTLMAYFLRDVHHYLFNKEFSPRNGITYQVRDEIRDRVIKMLQEVKADKHIVISHSMGTVIIYDCLKRVNECSYIDDLITIGSPLGLDEIQDKLSPEWTRFDGFPNKVKGSWINVYDGMDPVAMMDGNIDNDYKKNGEKVIKVIKENNWGSWRHDISKYLQMPLLRSALQKLFD
ncbi:hypothetical protein IX39_20330 [Chryseobacterium formosense]|uniref:Alpha/beta hydrolase n=1 Tax=Chryseobacterium formosense TaxID=236814 RepID=A0A085YYT2_9FLAO|nr:hypothetical protein [Chryseobacterium formosense]KFE97345.1 hypothetical protein IX39_20330 [Chryseobacterium formosense]SFT91258.1 hypothetical protein SAMN05421857_4079 [Chryseobacterium formosense]